MKQSADLGGIPTESFEALIQLQHNIDLTVANPQLLEIYTGAIEELKKSYGFFSEQAPSQYESGDIFIFLFRVTEGKSMHITSIPLPHNTQPPPSPAIVMFCPEI
jgi:hypothetical protein